MLFQLPAKEGKKLKWKITFFHTAQSMRFTFSTIGMNKEINVRKISHLIVVYIYNCFGAPNSCRIPAGENTFQSPVYFINLRLIRLLPLKLITIEVLPTLTKQHFLIKNISSWQLNSSG